MRRRRAYNPFSSISASEFKEFISHGNRSADQVCVCYFAGPGAYLQLSGLIEPQRDVRAQPRAPSKFPPSRLPAAKLFKVGAAFVFFLRGSDVAWKFAS
jgi:hypothetical protein